FGTHSHLVSRVLVCLPTVLIQRVAVFVSEKSKKCIRPWAEGMELLVLSFPISILAVSVLRVIGYRPQSGERRCHLIQMNHAVIQDSGVVLVLPGDAFR